MSDDHDLGGDYGYDMAHEVAAALRMPVHPVRTSGAWSVTCRVTDTDGDFGYDQAHDL